MFLGEDQVYEGKVLRPFPRDMAYIGTVTEVLTYPAHKLYKVRGPEKCYLIPAVQDIFIVDNLLSVGSCKLEWFPL